MADEKDQVDTSELDGINDDEAEQLLGKLVEDDDDQDDDRSDRRKSQDSDDDAEHLGDRGKRALDRERGQRKSAEKRAAELEAELQKFRDANKSDLEKLTEERDRLRDSSTKATAEARALRVAMDAAPPHATLAHVRAVAKRVRGEDDTELTTDAEELFELIAPAPSDEPKSSAKTPSRPKERLRGGSDPEEDDGLPDDPRKLAALLPRTR